MARSYKKRNYKINKDIKRNQCRIIEDGKTCKKRTHCRGLCSGHHQYLLRNDLLEKYGTKLKYDFFDIRNYKINKNPKSGKCRTVTRNKACNRFVHGRGLCSFHWMKFDRHGVLLKYGTKSRRDPIKITVKKKIEQNICRIRINDEGCDGKTHAHGLCRMHYQKFKRKGILKKFGMKRKRRKNE